MTRFTFRLERVLQLRLAAEEEKARDLGTAQAVERAARAGAESCAAALAEAVRQVAASGAKPVAAGAIGNLMLAVEGARARAEQAAARHRESLAAVEAAREAWEQARRDRRALEKLRESRLEAWKLETARAEQAVLDDVASRLVTGGGTA